MALKASFDSAMADLKMETCSRCHECWFQKGLDQDGICTKCLNKDCKIKSGDPFFYSEANEMDPGVAPAHLPTLSMIEGMIIAKVHVSVNVLTIRGGKHKYRGHVVHFLKDIGSICRKLPLLPPDLDVVILKPAGADANPQMQRQFRQRFRVRQHYVRQWIHFLKANHPGYHDVEIDEIALSSLPRDGDVTDSMPTQEFQDEDGGTVADQGPDTEDAEGAADEETAIPDLLVKQSELEELMNRVDGDNGNAQDQFTMQTEHPVNAHIPSAHHLSLPNIRPTPLNEFNRQIRLLSLTFPTLYPTGKADFATARPREVTYAEYISHMIKYQDGRFARHPLWAYTVYNTLMRQRTLSASRFYVKQYHKDELTLDQVKKALEDPNSAQGKKLLGSINRQIGNIPGTVQFWRRKRQELISMCNSLRLPLLFITFSYADLHWRDLHRHIADLGDGVAAYDSLSEAERIVQARKNVIDYPHVVSAFFVLRFQLFREHVLRRKFNINDEWHRYEWQSRLAVHNHGLYWGEGGPVVDMDNADARADFARVWGYHISSFNPDLASLGHGGGGNPLAGNPLEDQNTWEALASWAMRCQRHHCSTAYCLRRRLSDARNAEERGLPPPDPVCRFGFPQQVCQEATVGKPPGYNFDAFIPARNDPLLNQYNPLFGHTWKANIDISPCTGKQAVINYAAKYCSKGETKSATHENLLNNLSSILSNIKDSNNHPFHTFVQKFMNKAITERDIGKNEVLHVLLQLPFQEDTRVISWIDVRPVEDHRQHLNFRRDGELTSSCSPYEKYLQRVPEMEDATYSDFIHNWNYKSPDPTRWRPWSGRAKPRVICYHPQYKGTRDTPGFEDFCRVKLLLNHPHRRDTDLHIQDDISFPSWEKAFDYCEANHLHDEDDHYGDVDKPLPEPDEEQFEVPELECDLEEGDFEELARMLPQLVPEQEDLDLLGRRDIDVNYRWEQHLGRYPDDGFSTEQYWKKMKTKHPIHQECEYLPWSARHTLNREQRFLYNRIIKHYLDCNPLPLRIHLDGGGGTGKTYLITVLSSHLQRLARKKNMPSPILRAAPTGTASNLIQGYTLHSLLRLPIQGKELESASGPVLKELQAKFRGVRYLVIDEKSMIGLHIFGWIDQRLRQIFPINCNVFFGGLSVILSGDFFQLPPVRQKPLFSKFTSHHNLSPAEVGGLLAYQSVKHNVFLTTIQRQAGDTEAPFRQALAELRELRVSEPSWRVLSSRCAVNLSIAELDTFSDAPAVYFKKLQVNKINHARMVKLNSSVIYVHAENVGPGVDKLESNAAGNLSQKIPLCVGARMMLTYNLWTEAGLSNGVQGIIYDIGWATDADAHKSLPFVVWVVFDGYNGPAYKVDGQDFLDEQGHKIVPIYPIRHDFIHKGQACSRRQLPLIVGYAITVHKSQGASLDRIRCDISEQEFASGLSYVAVSRVKTLGGLLFETPFGRDRLYRENHTPVMQARINDYVDRQGHLLSQYQATQLEFEENDIIIQAEEEIGPDDDEDGTEEEDWRNSASMDIHGLFDDEYLD
jgi:hypothetical protein